MKSHNFVYNYGFLADWRKANPTVKRNELLQCFDMGDYATLAKWIKGETMMPLGQMLRFCNQYSVPIAFFFDEKATKGDLLAPITINSFIEPSGGWPNTGRKAGMKVYDPRTTMHYPSNLPPYVPTVQNATKENNNEGDNPAKQQTAQDCLTSEERMEYLRTINKLNDRVLELVQKIITLQERLAEQKQ